MEPVCFQTDPSKYIHWEVEYEGAVAKLSMNVNARKGLRDGYELKLNSYDLGVDIELADCVRRLRFEHPEISTLIVTSGHDQVFCAGANITMLGLSTHGWKVNFCKFTNETRCEIESLCDLSDFNTIAALTGTCAGGGYELAMACEEIWLVDDGSSAVSLPETPLLAVLPGTGGLTRLVDKRKVRRDRADIFCTLAEGLRGNRAVKWGLVDKALPRSKFMDGVQDRAKELAEKNPRADRKGVSLGPLELTVEESARQYSSLRMEYNEEERSVELCIHAPGETGVPSSAEEALKQGQDFWPLRFARELDDAILDLRVNHNHIGLVLVKSKGLLSHVKAYDDFLVANQDHWFIKEVIGLLSRVIQRLERTAASFFALIEEGSCFGGTFLEIALACDRLYMLDEDGVEVQQSPMNEGLLPMTTEITRNYCRLMGEPELLEKLKGDYEVKDAIEAEDAGLVTESMDDIDFEDGVRVAIEERVSLSPDSLTGMEANLRFAGPENMDSKIFGRLTAWQNWIFIRPNATGEEGALTLYGQPDQPHYDFNRV